MDKADNFCEKQPCLFNVVEDPTGFILNLVQDVTAHPHAEHDDIAASNPSKVKELFALFQEYSKSEVSVEASGWHARAQSLTI